MFAVTNIELAAYNQRLNLSVGDKLPEPLEITGFEYVGYLKSGEQVKVNAAGNHQLPIAKRTCRLFEVNKQAGKSVSFSENTSAPISQYLLKQRNRQSKKKPLCYKEHESAFDVFQLLNYLNCNSRAKTAPKPKSCLIKLSTNIQGELAEGQAQIIRKGISGTRTVITRSYIAGKEIVKAK